MLAETLSAYVAARQKSPPLPSGSAPFTSAESFKTRDLNGNSSAKLWDHHLSFESKQQAPSTLKAASRVSNPESIISLGTARPAPQYYPWQAVTMATSNIDKDNSISIIETSCIKGEAAYDLGLVLNYGYAAGSPQILRFITEHVEMIHRPLYRDWECAMTCGTTSAIDVVFRMLCDRGQSVLCEDFSYPGTIEAAKKLGLKMIGIKMDEQGLIAEELGSKLENWAINVDGPKPRLLYTIPTGQNPTGATQGCGRRKAIYAIAEKHDLLILEDDPYFFIQLQDEPHLNGHGPTSTLSSGEKYIRSLPPSYLSLDVSGRVIRLDATSKILAPGLRCGWITACAQLVQQFIQYTELSMIAPSGPSQMMLYKLLDESWGHEGFINWLQYLSSQYRQRLKTLTSACLESLPEGLCHWTVPSAGMFLWVHIDWPRHPTAEAWRHDRAGENPVLAIEDKIYVAARDNGVMVSRGSWFSADKESCGNVSFRLTFAAAADKDLKEAIDRFGKALRAEFQIEG